jgi:hypothetical protein
VNFSLQWIVTAVDSVADFVRSALPWQYRSLASNWAVFAVVFAVAAIVLGLIHLLQREKPKIDWNFVNSGYPVRLSWSQTGDGIRTYHVDGIDLGGENISGHTLHQIDGEITLTRDKKTLPLFVVINGAWAPMAELDGVPSRALMYVGFGFRSDGVHHDEFSKRMTPDQFLRDFGSFTFSITIDGDKKLWSFTIDELRNQFEKQKRDAEEEYLKNPMNRPQLKKKQPA